MKNQKGFAPIILLIALVVAIGILGEVYFLSKANNQSINSASQSPTSSLTPSNTSSISNTKSYKNISTESWVKFTSPIYNPYYTDSQIQKAKQVSVSSTLVIDDSYNAKVSFSLLLPVDWKQSYDENGINGNKDQFGAGYIFTKGKLEIRMGRFFAPGGNLCSKKMLTAPYTDIVDASPIIYRRNTDFAQKDYIPKGFTRFNICVGKYEKNLDNFAENTSSGEIIFTLPDNYSDGDLAIMDKIITTLHIEENK